MSDFAREILQECLETLRTIGGHIRLCDKIRLELHCAKSGPRPSAAQGETARVDHRHYELQGYTLEHALESFVELARTLERERNEAAKLSHQYRNDAERLERKLAEAQRIENDLRYSYAAVQQRAEKAEADRDDARLEIEAGRVLLEAAEAEVAALRRDAERYRWLRTPRNYVTLKVFRYEWQTRYQGELDAYIDAARNEKEAGK